MTVADLKELLKNKDDDDIVLILNLDGDESDGTEYTQLEVDDLWIRPSSFQKLAKQNGWIKE